MLLTVYSSFLFGITSYYGYCFNDWMGNWFAVLTPLSILNHSIITDNYTRISTHKIVLFIDRIVAHSIYARVVYDAIWYTINKTITEYLIIYWLCSLWVFYAFKIGKLTEIYGFRGELYHVTTHIAGSIGCTFLLFHKQLILN